MPEPLEKEFRYYLDHQARFVRKYNGKVIVLVGKEVLGVYPTPLEAMLETQKTRKVGTFLIQQVSSGKKAYTHRLLSRVSFR